MAMRFLLVMLLVVGSLGLTQVSLADQDEPASPSEVADLFDPSDPVYAAAAAEATAMEVASAVEFASPAAQERREESRAAFSDASNAEAVELIRETFPEAMTGPTEAVQEALPPNTEIAGFSSEFTAQLVDENGQPAGLLESTTPLTADPATGDPIDLSLSREGDDFVPAEPGVEAELPVQATDDAVLADIGVGFEPVGADPATAVKRADRLIYPSIDTDTDYVLQPVERGLEAFWQLRSAASPQTLRLDYELPPVLSCGCASDPREPTASRSSATAPPSASCGPSAPSTPPGARSRLR